MRKKEKGFTLIEILLALTILLIGIAGILVLFPLGLSATKDTIEDTVAANLAESITSSVKVAMSRCTDLLPADFDPHTPPYIKGWLTGPLNVDSSIANVNLKIHQHDSSENNNPPEQWHPSNSVWSFSGFNKSDRRDRLDQYSFRLRFVHGTRGVEGIFRVHIYIFRGYRSDWTIAENMNGPGGNAKRATLIKIFYTQIGVN